MFQDRKDCNSENRDDMSPPYFESTKFSPKLSRKQIYFISLFISSIKYIAISLYLCFLSRNSNQMQDTIIPVRNLQKASYDRVFPFSQLGMLLTYVLWPIDIK